MKLRDLLFERILFLVDEDDLREKYELTEEGVADLSDLDLLELFEDVHGLNGSLYE